MAYITTKKKNFDTQDRLRKTLQKSTKNGIYNDEKKKLRYIRPVTKNFAKINKKWHI